MFFEGYHTDEYRDDKKFFEGYNTDEYRDDKKFFEGYHTDEYRDDKNTVQKDNACKQVKQWDL